ncbi:MAG TPA: hypothetical protein VN604_07070 [Nitrospirota bacterium]|nr:hypothetical protein [Nitrospirota bacterium]
MNGAVPVQGGRPRAGTALRRSRQRRNALAIRPGRPSGRIGGQPLREPGPIALGGKESFALQSVFFP